MRYVTRCPSPVGTLTLASDGQSLTGLWIQGQRYDGRGLCAQATAQDDLPVFAQTKDWLLRFFDGEQPDAALIPLRLYGTPFQLAVWRALQHIPYGQTTTYGAIAHGLDARMSSRAVGGAVGRNPISILIPCHRVVGADGRLTGYAGGLAAKTKLLALEGVAVRDGRVCIE